MPKTNSESDFGGSLTSDAEDDIDAGPSSPIVANPSPVQQRPASIVTQGWNGKVYQRNPGSASSSKRPQSSRSKTNPLSPTRSSRRVSSRFNDKHDNDPKLSHLRGADLFRAAAHKVMRMHNTSSFWGTLRRGQAGAEPGIDPRHGSAHIAYGHIQQPCSINIIEYNSVRSKFQSFKNQSFIDFLDTKGTQTEPWVKVRWIHIGGISWDVISRLALVYGIFFTLFSFNIDPDPWGRTASVISRRCPTGPAESFPFES